MSPVYDTPITLSELGSSDHNMVLLRPTHGHSLGKGSTVRFTIRCMSSENRAKFSAMLSAVRWETMFRMRSCEEQFIFYQTVIDQLMCQCFPNKVVTRHSADKPWVTDGFRALKGSTVRFTIRCMSSENRAKFSAMLSAVRWETMFRMRSCEEQFIFYQTVIDQLMCQCFPNKVVTRHSADKPWVTDGFRALVRKRQRAHICGDLAQARLFRNKVNRAAVRLRKEFYQAKVATLSESSTREWWRHMKSLMGTTSNNDAEMQGLANNPCEGNIEVLANRINEFLVSVSSNLPRLTNDLAVFDVQDEIPAEYVISVMTTENALQHIKVNKAVGPDNVPAWVLRDNASTLAACPLNCTF